MYCTNTLIYIIILKSNRLVNSLLLFYSPISKYYSRVYTGAGGFQKSARGTGGQSRRPLTPGWGEKKGYP